MSIEPAVPTEEYAFPIRDIPFSTNGSWLDVSPVVGLNDIRETVHVVSHKTTMTSVVGLQPLAEGAGTWLGRPNVLTWTHESDVIEIVFQDNETIRIQGRGAGLRLEAGVSELYVDQVDDSYVLSVHGTGRRYRLTLLSGLPLEAYKVYDRSVVGFPWVASPAGQDKWEIAIEEMDAGAVPHSYESTFEELKEGQLDSFNTYLNQVAPWRSERTPAVVAAVYVDWATTVAPDGFITRPAMLMSMQWMDRVWSWDHCFNALAIARNAKASWDQYVIMFDHQTESGGIPDAVSHSEVIYNYPKPPIHGWALTNLLPRLTERPSEEELRAALDALVKWTNWWRTTMTAPKSKFAHYHFGNDSGWDNATLFGREAPLQTPDLSAFMVLQMEAISSLAAELGDEASATYWASEAQELLTNLLQAFWRETHFVALQARTGVERWSQCLLLAMPIVLGSRLPEDVIDGLVETIEGHLTEFGLATERTDSALYESDGYWRGPIWAPSTYLIVHGLRDAGRNELADKISVRFREMCERFGFAENFDALTGEGLRDRSYTWTASCYLLLAEEAELALQG
ncbi:amylo-alpha-1,6-glucosidase [Arthrobacter sp. GMC3]|uniref:amylo-alpha-1,6-glucosidase n=1 Tax=Arthrobacter sp. GMC3 TaxID=2058894 RepID=UPI000CE3BD4B|nr:trehalase family glycosidase [Arthrobacter sp. GMC3]